MKYVLILLLFFINNNMRFSVDFIEELSKRKDFGIIVCVPNIDGNDTLTVGTTNTILYHSKLYEEYKDSLQFEDLLIQLFNGKILIDSTFIREYNFKCQKTRLDTLQSKFGFEYLKKEFVVQKKENQFTPVSNLSQLEKYSLVNLFFNKEYIIIFDDYSGEFIFNDLHSMKQKK